MVDGFEKNEAVCLCQQKSTKQKHSETLIHAGEYTQFLCVVWERRLVSAGQKDILVVTVQVESRGSEWPRVKRGLVMGSGLMMWGTSAETWGR